MDEQINRVIGSTKQKSKRIKKEAVTDVEQELSRKKRKKSEQNTETVTKDITTSSTTTTTTISSSIYDGNNNNNFNSDNSVNNNFNRAGKSSKKRSNVLDTEISRGKVEIVISDTSTSSFHRVTTLDNEDFVVLAYWDACTLPSPDTIEYKFEKDSCKKLHATHVTNCKVTYVGSQYKHANLVYKLPDDERGVKIFKMRPIVPEKALSALLPEEMNKSERSDVIRSKFSSKKVARNLAQSKKHAVNLSQRDADRLEQLTFNTSVVEEKK